MPNFRVAVAFVAVTAMVSVGAPVKVQAQDWMKTLQDVVGTAAQRSAPVVDTTALSALTNEDMVAGLKEALRVGTETVSGQLGAVNGFNADPSIHIPLPRELQSVQSTLKKFGLGSLADEVELKLNRGAEAAMPKAKALVWQAISTMSLDDAKTILNGPDDAATQYFRRVATPELTATVAPVIEQNLQNVGAVAAYDQLLGQYKNIPFVPDLKADLTSHATTLALDGLFLYLAREEAAIRKDPAKRTTEILTKVFSAL
ncbi:DUF4197 domain-containing protein [Magnetovibrio sp.]|uniref:DUF4197 domain-containing protein n=1 Tax=Magnetovibrio sp. TaxID=2024836 RepID=UPI002F923BEA